MDLLANIIAICAVLAALVVAVRVSNRAYIFKAGAKYRSKVVEIADQVMHDDAAPDNAKFVVSVMIVNLYSTKFFRAIREAAGRNTFEGSGDPTLGLTGEYARLIAQAIESFAMLAVVENVHYAKAINRRPIEGQLKAEKKKDVRAVEKLICSERVTSEFCPA